MRGGKQGSGGRCRFLAWVAADYQNKDRGRRTNLGEDCGSTMDNGIATGAGRRRFGGWERYINLAVI